MLKTLAKTKTGLPAGLDKKKILNAYKIMLSSRELDQKMLILVRQGKSFFHIGCMGHEAVQIAAAFALEKKRDWLFPYYRDQAFCLALGETPFEMMLLFLAKGADPSSGGRQMPMHYGHADLNIVTSSSSTGTQYLQAVGNSFASMRKIKKGEDLEVTVVCSGDGTTSQGDFHEALSWACRAKAPVIFLIQNNKYAISVPIKDQRPGGKVAPLGKGYDGLEVTQVDGCDFVKSFEAMKTAVSRARSGKGPTLIDADVVRLLPHSSSDDQRKYRKESELEADKKRDPLEKMRQLIVKLGIANKKQIELLDREMKDEVEKQTGQAQNSSMPDRSDAQKYVLSPKLEITYTEPKISESDREYVLVDAINRALADELAREEKMLVFGQDVAGGKGGVFTATRGLTDKFGSDRCFNGPLAESSIVGVAIGLSMRGHKPVVEVQFGDYVWTAMMQIRNELATIRYRSNNTFSAPAVLRIPVGGYIHGGLCHSQNIEATFAHIPGLKIALPSTALDAYGLLKTAIRADDPVLFLEHKALYRQNFAKSKLPSDKSWSLPFGKGIIRRAGQDLTVVTYGIMVQKAIEAARELVKESVDVEVLDLRTISPYDFELIEQSVKKTSKVLVLHEDCRFMGFGAELAAEISDKLYKHLDGPVKRLAGKDTPVPYNWDLEKEILPQTIGIVNAIRELAAF